MIALLGVMIAVLTLISGLIGILFAGLSVYGYNTIKAEAKRVAASIASETSQRVAIEEAKKWEGLSLGLIQAKRQVKVSTPKVGSQRRKSDASLKPKDTR